MTQTHLNFLLFGLFPKIFKVIFLGGRGVPRIVVLTQFEYVYLQTCFFFISARFFRNLSHRYSILPQIGWVYDERIPNKAPLKRSCFGICFMALVHFWGAGKYWEVGCVQCSWGEWRAELIDRICQSPLFRATHRSRESGVRRCWQIQIQKNTQNTNQDAHTNKDIKRLQELVVIVFHLVNFGWENAGK